MVVMGADLPVVPDARLVQLTKTWGAYLHVHALELPSCQPASRVFWRLRTRDVGQGEAVDGQALGSTSHAVMCLYTRCLPPSWAYHALLAVLATRLA